MTLYESALFRLELVLRRRLLHNVWDISFKFEVSLIGNCDPPLASSAIVSVKYLIVIGDLNRGAKLVIVDRDDLFALLL